MQNFKEYTFKIGTFTTDTLPMARFAEYLRELSTILGEPSSVHFVRLEDGCVALVHKVDYEAVPKVQESTNAVKRGQGTVIQMGAYRHVNRMLEEDNTDGVLMEDKNVEIIKFPGKKEQKTKLTSVQQQGKIDGELIRIGGPKNIVPILLTIEGEEISGCHVNREMAKKLAKHLFEYVRLYGEGQWERNEEGEWNLGYFLVDRFEVIQETTISETIIALRGLKGEWGENALHEILESRHQGRENN